MQLSVYEIMTKLNVIRGIMFRIEEEKPIDDCKDDIYDALNEYSEILQSAKVKI